MTKLESRSKSVYCPTPASRYKFETSVSSWRKFTRPDPALKLISPTVAFASTTGSSWIQVIGVLSDGTKPLPEPMLIFIWTPRTKFQDEKKKKRYSRVNLFFFIGGHAPKMSSANYPPNCPGEMS